MAVCVDKILQKTKAVLKLLCRIKDL